MKLLGILRRKVFWFVVAVCVVGSGSYVWYQRSFAGEQSQVLAQSVTIPVSRTSLSRSISMTGQLKPIQDEMLLFVSGGRITEVLVAEGDRVAAGDPVARVDDTEARLEFLRAQREFEAARLDSPTSIIEERRLAMQLSQRRLEATTLRAPFSGTIVEVRARVGDQLGNQGAVARLVDLSSYKVDLTVDEKDMEHIERGQQVRVRVDAMPHVVLTGEVRRVGLLPSSTDGVILYPVEVVVGANPPVQRVQQAQQVQQVQQRIASQETASPAAGGRESGGFGTGQVTPERAAAIQEAIAAQGGSPGGAQGAQGAEGVRFAGAGGGANVMVRPGGGAGAAAVARPSDQTDVTAMLRPGSTVNIEVILEQVDNVLAVPLAAVVEAGPAAMVTRVARDGSRETVPVQTGLSDGLRVEIRSGLVEGDQVVMNNYQLYQTIVGNLGGGGGGNRGAAVFGMPGGGTPVRIPTGGGAIFRP